MPRKHSQGPASYDIAVANLEGEYARAIHNTQRSRAIYKGFIDRIDWCLRVLRKEQRELAAKSRGEMNGRTETNGASANSGAAAKSKTAPLRRSRKNGSPRAAA